MSKYDLSEEELEALRRETPEPPPAMSDKETNDMLRREWYEILSDLWTSFGKEPLAGRLKIYARQLGIIPLGLLEQSVSLAVRNQKYNTPPTVHAVFEALCEVRMCEERDIELEIAGWIDTKNESLMRGLIPK